MRRLKDRALHCGAAMLDQSHSCGGFADELLDQSKNINAFMAGHRTAPEIADALAQAIAAVGEARQACSVGANAIHSWVAENFSG